MNARNSIHRSGLATLLFAVMATAYALPEDKDQPIHIDANSAEHNEKTGVTSYSGDVLIQQGTLQITADMVIIKTVKDDSGKIEVDELTCTGSPAHLQQVIIEGEEPATASANRVFYKVPNQEIELFEGANLKKAGQILTGEHIIYNINEQHIQAKGPVEGSKPGGRVTVIIPPKKKTPKPDTPSATKP